MRTRATISLIVLTMTLAALAGVPAGAQDPPAETATATVVHGLRGRLVDVYLDGELALEAFKPERTTDPLQLPAGEHRVALRSAGDEPTAEPFASAAVTLPAGANLSLVAHLDASGEPTVSTFRNDTSTVAAGQGRLVARNTAFAPPVAVLVDGSSLVGRLATSDEFGTELDPRTYRVAVNNPAGERIVPPDEVPVPEGTSTIMYLIGSQQDQSLIWIGQSIDGLQAAPSEVPTGNSGLAAPAGPDGPPGWWAVVLIAGAVSVLTGGWWNRRRRSTR